MSDAARPLVPAALPLPPGPRGLPVVGDALRFGRNPLAYLTNVARHYGPVARIPFGPGAFILASSPAAVEEVLTQSRRFPKEDIERARYSHDYLLFGTGLLTSNGDFWLRQRRLAQPAFHRQRIASYGQAMITHTERMLADWRPGQQLDIHDAMMELTLKIVAETLFGVTTEQEAGTVGRALEVVMNISADTLGQPIPIPTWLPTPGNRRFRRAVAEIEGLIAAMVAERRVSGEDRGDLLSMLLHARDEDGSVMSDKQLRDEAITLFLAGHETTALALSWAFYLLGRHPEVDQRLADELQQVLDGRALTLEDLPRLSYTGLVLKEVMRLYPPAWILSTRVATEETSLGGYRILKGDAVVVSPWVTQRDATLFPEPLQFRPERWANGLESRLPRFAYFPFGGGQRLCIGQSFALMEASLILAAVASRYRLEIAPDLSVTAQPSITLRPREGVRATLRARE